MGIELRPATHEDVGLIADLETAHTPDDPHDPQMVLYWWTHEPDARHAMRLVGDTAYFSARHRDWKASDRRYGVARIRADFEDELKACGTVGGCPGWIPSPSSCTETFDNVASDGARHRSRRRDSPDEQVSGAAPHPDSPDYPAGPL